MADQRPAHEVLTRDQMRRYARHIALREVGGVGQLRLLGAHVRLKGAGPGAEEAARYLAAAGVGRLTLDGALAARLGPELGALNPDCRVTSSAQDGRAESESDGGERAEVVEVGPVEPDDRLEGALLALRVMGRVVGFGPAGGEAEGFRWETPRP